MFSGLIGGIRYEGSLFYVFFYSEFLCLLFVFWVPAFCAAVRMRGGLF